MYLLPFTYKYFQYEHFCPLEKQTDNINFFQFIYLYFVFMIYLHLLLCHFSRILFMWLCFAFLVHVYSFSLRGKCILDFSFWMFLLNFPFYNFCQLITFTINRIYVQFFFSSVLSARLNAKMRQKNPKTKWKKKWRQKKHKNCINNKKYQLKEEEIKTNEISLNFMYSIFSFSTNEFKVKKKQTTHSFDICGIFNGIG